MDVSPTINSIHGRIRSITGTDPATGAEISETVPPRRRWIIHAIHFAFITNATVANREIRLYITDGTNTLHTSPIVTVQTASKNNKYSFANTGAAQFFHDEFHVLPLPNLPLLAGFIITTGTDALQAGDNYSAPQLLVEEWIDP